MRPRFSRPRVSAKAGEQSVRDRAGPAAADRPLIDLDDRHDLTRRAGQERLIRPEEIFVAEDLFPHRDPFLFSDLEEKLPRDPRKEPGFDRRRHARCRPGR